MRQWGYTVHSSTAFSWQYEASLCSGISASPLSCLVPSPNGKHRKTGSNTISYQTSQKSTDLVSRMFANVEWSTRRTVRNTRRCVLSKWIYKNILRCFGRCHRRDGQLSEIWLSTKRRDPIRRYLAAMASVLLRPKTPLSDTRSIVCDPTLTPESPGRRQIPISSSRSIASLWECTKVKSGSWLFSNWQCRATRASPLTLLSVLYSKSCSKLDDARHLILI